MSAWPTVDTPDALSLAQAEELGLRARTGIGPEHCALSMRQACELAGVRVLSQPLAVGARRHTAMLVPTGEGFRALVDSLLWRRARTGETGRRRLRFVLAHELGHTLFYRPGRPPTRTSQPDRLEEQFCHRFATALLVPPGAALQAPLDPHGLHALAGRYDVSERVAAWAIARARPSLSLLWLRRAPHPRRGGEEKMRVQWAASLGFVPVGESFKSQLAELAPGQHGRSNERLRLGGRDHYVDLLAWRFRSAMLVVVRHHEHPHHVDGQIAAPFPRQLALLA